jgi:trk system potassium uptake protein TrkH
MIREISVQGRRVSEADISAALLFIAFHAAVIFLSAILISADGYSFVNSLFETTSAAGCVGLSAGVVSAHATVLAKSVIITDMLLGRIEYLHVLLLMAVIFGKKTITLTRQ